jgi:hypothetical protein
VGGCTEKAILEFVKSLKLSVLFGQLALQVDQLVVHTTQFIKESGSLAWLLVGLCAALLECLPA